MKESKKQIEAALRNKMAAQYKTKTERLEQEIARLEKRNAELTTRAHKAEQEKLEMRDRLQQYEDWNNRLQEFMDMNEEDRVQYVETLRAQKELDDAVNSLYSVKLLKHYASLLLP